jgi:hypothetical protein
LRINALVAGYTGGSIVYRNNGQILNGANYYTDRDVHNNVFSRETYAAGLDAYKEAALHRAMAPILYLTKLEDGSLSVEPKSLTRDEVLALRAENLQEMEINWGALKFRLANRMPSVTNLDHVGYDLDYFASEYVQYRQRITTSYTGDKQAEELQKLESLFAEYMEKYAEHFAALAGDFLERHGVSGEREAIRASILDLFRQRAAAYADFVQQNDDYAGIKGTADEWLLVDDLFMGEQLRYAYAARSPDWKAIGAGGYGVDDLAALGTLVKETWNVGYESWRWGFVNRHKSEEEFGFELGLTAMKYALVTKIYNISDKVKSKLDTAFQNFLKDQNEQAQDYITRMRSDPFVRDKRSYAVDWNVETVLAIIRRLVEHVEADDPNQAFQEDFALILARYHDRTQDPQTRELARYQAYHNSWAKSPYIADWNQFVRRLALSAGLDLSRYGLQDGVSRLDLRA